SAAGLGPWAIPPSRAPILSRLAGGLALRLDDRARLPHHPALVLEAEPGDPLVPGEPLGPRDLAGVEVGGVAADIGEQEVVHLLVDPVDPLLHEPVLDSGQGGHHAAGDARLLPHLAHGGLLGGLPLLDVPLGELPAAA